MSQPSQVNIPVGNDACQHASYEKNIIYSIYWNPSISTINHIKFDNKYVILNRRNGQWNTHVVYISEQLTC